MAENAFSSSNNAFTGVSLLPASEQDAAIPNPITDPVNFLEGFAGNWMEGMGQMVTGAIPILGAIGHDIVAGIQEVIPGEQLAEREGYMTWQKGRQLPGFFVSDIADRYGGLSNIARGLYEQPFSYALDALMLGGAAAGAAKMGRIGGVLSRLPKVLPQGTAEKILGGSALTNYRGTLSVVNPVAGMPMGVPAPYNPATRFLVNEAFKAASMSEMRAGRWIEKLAANPAAYPEYVRAEAALQYAVNNGIRVLRPGVANYLTGRFTGKALGAMRVEQRALAAEAAKRIEAHYEHLSPEERVLSGYYTRGIATPPAVTRDFFNPIDDIDIGPSTLDPMNVPKASLFQPTTAQGVSVPIRLYDEFKDTGLKHTNFETPHAGKVFGDDPRFQTYTIIVADPADIPATKQRILEKTGTREVGSINYMTKPDYLYDGYHFFATTDDGAMFDFSIATQPMYEAQRAYGRLQQLRGTIAERLAEVQGKYAALRGEAQKLDLVDPENTEIMMKLLAAEQDVTLHKYYMEAADKWGEDLLRGHRMAYWSQRLGTEVEPALLAAETGRALTFNEISAPWLGNRIATGDVSVAATAMERAYYEQRLFLMKSLLREMREEYHHILSGPNEDVTDKFLAYLASKNLPEPVISQIVGGKKPYAGVHINEQLEKWDWATNEALKDFLVNEGGRGLDTFFPEYDWRVMRADRMDAGLPVPSYFHHFPDQKKKAYGMTRGASFQPGTPTPWMKMKGILLEQGRVLDDPAEAFTRAAASTVYHAEAAETLQDIVMQTGRELSKQDVLDFVANQYSGEVLVPLDQAKGLLSLRAELIEDTLTALPYSRNIDDAIITAVKSLHAKVVEQGVDAIANTRVFAVPKKVMATLEQEMKTMFGETVRLYVDGPMNLWKSSVLSLSLRWLQNNIFGNGFMMAMRSPGALRIALEQMDKDTAGLTKFLLEPIGLKKIERGFFAENAKFGSVLPEDATGFLGTLKSIHDSRAARPVTAYAHWIRTGNTFIEQASRRGVFVNEIMRSHLNGWVQGFHSTNEILKEAMRKGDLTEGKLRTILDAVDNTLGNYTRYTPIEQNIIKRFLVPFYGFFRHAVKFAVRMPFEYPNKSKILQMIDQMDREMEPFIPEWIRSRFGLWDIGQNQLTWNVRAWNPLSQFSDPQPLTSILNPVLKLVIERQLGLDTFTGEPFPTPDDVIETWNGDYYKMQYDQAGRFLGVVKMDGKPLPSLLAHIGFQFPQLAILPGFSRYPKSTALQVLNLFGAPLSELNREAIEQSAIEGLQDATTTAVNRIGGGGNAFDSVFA